MRQVTRYEALLFTLAGPLVFLLLAIFIDPILLRNIFNSLALGVFVLVSYGWLRPMLEEISIHGNDGNSGSWVIVLGVFYWAFTLAWQRVYAIAVLYFDRAPWLVDGLIAAFVPFSLMWGGFLFLAAPDMVGKIPERSHRSVAYIVIAALIGAFAAVLVGLQALPF